MKTEVSLGFMLVGLCFMPVASLAQVEITTPPPQATFPPSERCTTATPCRNVTGEVVKIEESYWIQFPNGQQTHVRVKPDTKIDARVKVGDSIAAQLTSTGDASSVIKLSETPQSVELPTPEHKLSEMRK
ncbi:MAG: hypothetical protein K0S45_1184 [Nitrospira sp.]|jgi:hypothetical protein|nr:hypothetical protein [Nitrospira sp.]